MICKYTALSQKRYQQRTTLLFLRQEIKQAVIYGRTDIFKPKLAFFSHPCYTFPLPVRDRSNDCNTLQ
jgi:hypothetical protein